MGTVTINSLTINNASGANNYGPFYNNQSITSVDLSNVPWTNNDMGSAFSGCNKLVTVTNIPPNITNMYNIFRGCTSMVDAPVLPNSVTTLGGTWYEGAFAFCSALVNAPIIPNSVTNMCFTFGGCRSLINAPIIPDSVTNMTYTFYGCSDLNSIPKVSNTATTLFSTFQNCIHLKTAPIIPSSVTEIGVCFGSCTELAGDIYIYSSRIKSAANCFTNTTNSKNVYIPYNISLGIYTDTYNSFRNAGYTTAGSPHGVYLKENPAFEVAGDWWWCNYDGIIHKYLGTSTSLTFPNSINGISTAIVGNHTFYNQRGLTSINLNNIDIKGQLDHTFAACTNLTTITNVPNLNNHGITEMIDTFAGCDVLTTMIDPPYGVTTLQNTYAQCNRLSRYPVIPNTVTEINNLLYFCNLASAGNEFNLPDSVVNIRSLTWSAQRIVNPFTLRIGKNVEILGLGRMVFTGNVYIRSNKITTLHDIPFAGTERKNVYVPFTNTDGTPSATYSTFRAAGYDSAGTINGVYLMNYTDLYSEY